MTPTDYEFLSGFLLQSSGLALGAGKEYLLEARLTPLAQSWGLSNYEELIGELRKGQDLRLSTAVTETMTTNETSFFRDKTPFEDLKNIILPALIESRKQQRSLRIWSAAASTGQELYSFLMMLRESFPELKTWNVEIIGTDIAVSMLDRCEGGVYSQFEVQRGLPTPLLIKYFKQDSNGWKISDDLRKQVSWRQQNLLESFSHLGQFDLIMCRNVLIYFEVDVKKQVIDRMSAMMRPDGYYMLGAAESVVGVTDTFNRFRDCRSAVYKPA